MSRYRKTFREALEEIKLAEVGYLMPRMTPAQLDNIKKVWDKKKASELMSESDKGLDINAICLAQISAL